MQSSTSRIATRCFVLTASVALAAIAGLSSSCSSSSSGDGSDAGGSGDGATDVTQGEDAVSGDDGPGDDGARGDAMPGDAGKDAATLDADASDAAGWHTALGLDFNLNDLVTTPSGVTYVIGARQVNSAYQGVVMRLSASGAIDTTFGTAGVASVVTSGTYGNQPLHGVVTSDGSLVLIGVVYSTPWDISLTRLDATGAIDTTYGTQGVTLVHAGVGNDLPGAIVEGPSGGVLFTGLAYGASFSQSDLVTGRVTSSGALDTTFDGDGVATTSLTGGNVLGRGIGLLSGDRVLVAAQSNNVGDFVLVRYTSAGALDTSFSTGQDASGMPAGSGVLRFMSVSDTKAEGLKKDSTGKWVVYGTGQLPSLDGGATRSAAMATRIDEDGNVDSTFHGGGGPFYPTLSGQSFGYYLAPSSGGRSVLSGAVYEGPNVPFDSSQYWPLFIVLGADGNPDQATLGVFKGVSVPHAYAGSDGLVAPLPGGHFAAAVSGPSSIEVFEIVP